MPNGTVTLGLSLHRPELLPLFAHQARRHEVIVLEEPPDTELGRMLSGELRVDDYLARLDTEYPEFSREMCLLIRKFHGEGKKILQVEPFLKTLIGVHEFFADGHRPGELQHGTLGHSVYLAEKRATGALVNFYNTVVRGCFDQTVEAVKRFARLDAARFRLRDRLRSIALEDVVNRSTSVYIEAGTMHLPLYRLLKRQLRQPQRLKLVFLSDQIVEGMMSKKRLYGPGDRLTLRYILNPGLKAPERETVLAARSLVQAKIIAKEEITDSSRRFPHTRDEIEVIDLVDRLSVEDCRRLFPLIKRTTTAEARQIVSEHLAENNGTGRRDAHETGQI